MRTNTVKFVFNQTTYFRGQKYQAGDTLDVSVEQADEWNKLSFGNVYKPRGNKKEKA